MITIKSSQVDEAEEFLFAATTTGDVVKVRLNRASGLGEFFIENYLSNWFLIMASV